MPKKISELTESQQAAMSIYVDKWTKLGLSTKPANHAEAEIGINQAYQLAGLGKPKQIIWVDSPLALTKACLGPNNILNNIWNNIWNNVCNNIKINVWDNVWINVWDNVWINVWDNVLNNVWDNVWEFSYLAMFDYYRNILDLKQETDPALGLIKVAENASWWIPYQEICYIAERPTQLHLNSNNQLHHDNKPAITWKDDYKIYAINGVIVPEQVVLTPHTQTITQIRTEPNAEVKRIRIERFGWQQYLTQIKATVLDQQENHIETTTEALMQTPEGETILVCSCPSTAKVFSLETESKITSCDEAQDWLSGGLSKRIINVS